MRFLGISLSLSLILTPALSHRHSEVVKFAPLTPGSKGPTIDPAVGYYTEAFDGGAYVIGDGVSQAALLVSTEGVILLDAPPTMFPNIRYAIGNITSKPVTHLVYSHSHADHISGAGLIKSWFPKVKIIGHTEAARRLKIAKDRSRPVPDITFDKQKELHIGNQTLQLAFKGVGHSADSIFIYAPRQKVLMAVDLIFPGWIPFASLAVSEDIQGWVEAHSQVLEYDFKHYVGGHLTRAGNRTDVETQKSYLEDLFNACKKALEGSTATFANTTSEVAQANPGNPFAVFDVYLDSVAKTCDAEVSKKWLSVLAAYDVFGYSNAFVMVEHLRLFYGVLGPFSPPA